MADLGPERPGQASETRQWGERNRTEEPHTVSNLRFFLLLGLMIAALVVFFVLR